VKREDLEHVVRAASDIVGDAEIVVVGSQAILGQHPDAPESLLVSIEADLYPRNRPERAIEIDGAIGDGSRFHETYGYYAHGVGPETPIAPAGWEQRLVAITMPAIRPREGTVTAWCLEAHDLTLAKLAAGRAHDLVFVEEALRSELVDRDKLLLGVELMPPDHRELVRGRLAGLLARVI
jgi:hypothetical protein